MLRIFYFLFFVSSCVYAQSDSLNLGGQIPFFGLGLNSEASFYTYQFPDGRIFVEVDYYQQSLDHGSMEDAIHPRGGSSYWDAVMFNIPNAYLIMDSNGLVLENFGVRANELQRIEKTGKVRPNKYFSERFKQTRIGAYHRSEFTYEDENGPVFHLVKNGKMGSIDTNGLIRIPFEYDQITFSEGDYFVSKDGLLGMYNSSFELGIPLQYKMIKKVADNSYLVFDDAYYFVDQKGKNKNKGFYKSVSTSPDWNILIATKYGRNFFLLDKKLNRVNDEDYRWVDHLEHSFFIVSDSSNLMAIVDSTGKRITDFKYQSFRPRFESKNYILVKAYTNENRYLASGLIDRKGREVLETKYASIQVSYDGKITGNLDGKWHLYSSNGDQLTNRGYDKILHFHKSHAVVQNKGLNGIINDHGEEILPVIYSQVASMDSGVVVVRNDTRKLAMLEMKTSKKLTEFIYDNVFSLKNGYLRAYRNQQWYFLDLNGKETGPLEYDEIYDFTKHGYALVRKGKHYGAIDTKGKLVAPCEYDNVSYDENYQITLIKGKVKTLLK